LCAYNVHNGHTGVGLNAYVGDGAGSGQWSGPFGRVVSERRQMGWYCGGGGGNAYTDARADLLAGAVAGASCHAG